VLKNGCQSLFYWARLKPCFRTTQTPHGNELPPSYSSLGNEVSTHTPRKRTSTLVQFSRKRGFNSHFLETRFQPRLMQGKTTRARLKPCFQTTQTPHGNELPPSYSSLGNEVSTHTFWKRGFNLV